MDKIKWAVIGTGKIAHTFAEALRGTDDAQLYAVASRTKERAQSFADEFGFEKAYGSYEELAEDSSIDVVYIATPMAAHYDNAMLCIKHGLNVLCEKTVTLNSGQFREVLDAAREHDVFFMEAMWMKCRPTYLKVMDWINSGLIGDIKYIKADFSNFIPYSPEDRLFRSDCGGGALLDLAVYPLTLTHAILGMPDEIITDAHIGADGIDLSNHITLRYNSGAFASMDSGFEIQLRNNAIISGTKGFITMGNWFHCTCEAALFDRQCRQLEESNIPVRVNGYEYEIDEVHRCLRAGVRESSMVPHAGTAEVLSLMDKCRAIWGMRFPQE